MSMLKVYPLKSRSQDSSVKQPKEITSFSRNINNEYLLDDSQLSYYYLPDSDLNTPGGIDLQSGFNEYQPNPNDDFGEFTGLLKAIIKLEQDTGKKVSSDIITWRGLMRSLMTLPFENRNKIVLNIIPFDGQLFIQTDPKHSHDVSQLELSTRSELNQRQMYSGYKFETISTLIKPWAECTRKEIEKRGKLPVNNIEQYSTVVRTSFGKTKLIMGAEIDCVYDYKPSDSDPLPHYAELKTSRIIDSPKALFSFENKLLKTWAQCFLVGVPKIIYGFRDDNLILRSIEEFKTEEIPLLFKNNPLQQQQQQQQSTTGKSSFKNKCMQSLKFFHGLINWINETVPKDDESKTYRLVFDPSTNVNYLNLTENTQDVTDSLLDTNIPGGLSKEFIDWRKELRSR
ncbi:hypothetical protein CANARDRAFT_232887 [[Candida] arabinofermentans NRRL YB-2248]|uniref:Decapping nuclease n=1 Tax=[Candida] arabinofermentans NRRL YB-2248 TaxID=983967 RepID=A0A1E4T296_9ASCO|nr:hypothetical protein CANARDRAFT_232887 [[Candida] arabinofermentans NRRL YB-2248]